VKLIVNGNNYEHDGENTIAGLLAAMGGNADKVAVAVNDDVIPRAERTNVRLKENDCVEILVFAAGG
jgi:sulfur carrier protein